MRGVSRAPGLLRSAFLTTATGGTIQTWRRRPFTCPMTLRRLSSARQPEKQISEAEVIRQSIRQVVGAERLRPRGGLFSSGHPIARRTDELLSGFGER